MALTVFTEDEGGSGGMGVFWSGDLETFLAEGFDESMTSLEIPQHRLGQQLYRLAFLAPLQLLLGRGQMLQAIPEPEQGRFAMAHSPHARVIVVSDDGNDRAWHMPIDAIRGRGDASGVSVCT